MFRTIQRIIIAVLLVSGLIFIPSINTAYADAKADVAKYTAAINADPNNASNYYYRGDAYRQLEDYNKAIADFTKAIQLKPNSGGSYRERGIAFFI